MFESMTNAVAAGVEKAFANMANSIWTKFSTDLQNDMNTVLIGSAMFGLIFWAAGSETAGRVVWWSIVIFTLSRAFGPQVYLYVLILAAIKCFVGRR